MSPALIVPMFLAAGAVVVALTGSSAPPDEVSACTTVWSAEGHVLSNGTVAAPDGARRVETPADGVTLGFVSQHAPYQHVETWANPFVTEVAWSPDSRRLAVTASEGGWVGTWETKVYVAAADGRMHEEPIDLGIASRPPLPACFDQERSNIAFVAWLHGGKQGLMVEEVPPHSSCSNMGALRAMVYDFETRRVSEVLGEPQLRRRYATYLGCRVAVPSENRRAEGP